MFRANAEIVRGRSTWNLADRLDYHARALHFFYFAVGAPLRYAGTRTASFDAATAEGSLISLPLRGRRTKNPQVRPATCVTRPPRRRAA